MNFPSPQKAVAFRDPDGTVKKRFFGDFFKAPLCKGSCLRSRLRGCYARLFELPAKQTEGLLCGRLQTAIIPAGKIINKIFLNVNLSFITHNVKNVTIAARKLYNAPLL